MILCVARLGLRATEVVQLELEDIDWRSGTVRVRRRKTGHGALLPLPQRVGAAVADYLQNGRPDTSARQVFVLHMQRVGAPISVSIVGRAVDNALRRAGIDAPTRGANLLRHSLATDLVRREASHRRRIEPAVVKQEMAAAGGFVERGGGIEAGDLPPRRHDRRSHRARPRDQGRSR